MTSIEAKRKARTAFMNELYNRSGGSERFYEHYQVIGDAVGLDRWEEASDVADYLVAEGVAQWMTMGHLGITHAGIVEIERSRSNPAEPTEHFAAYNNLIIGSTFYNSQIQQGGAGAIQVQRMAPDQLTSAIHDLVDAFRANMTALELSDDQRGEVEAGLATLEAQASSPKPKADIVEVAVMTLWSFAVSAAGSVAAQALMHHFAAFGIT
jgi:hypothetical protein